MPGDAMLILYLANSVFLICHEIDSAYWQEWNLFGVRGGINAFLVIHVPLVLLVLLGLLEVQRGTGAGYYFSVVLSLAGVVTFLIHRYFLRKGRREFTAFMSRFILAVILVISILQMALTVYLF